MALRGGRAVGGGEKKDKDKDYRILILATGTASVHDKGIQVWKVLCLVLTFSF